MLSFKTTLLLALACGKHVGDLEYLSVNPACLEVGWNDCAVKIWTGCDYVPKVLTTPFKVQVITAQMFIPEVLVASLHLFQRLHKRSAGGFPIWDTFQMVPLA